MARKKTQDELDLERMHTIEDEGLGNIRSTFMDGQFDPNNLTDSAMQYLNQIKEIQERLQSKILEVQELEMMLMGYTQSLNEELSAKGH